MRHAVRELADLHHAIQLFEHFAAKRLDMRFTLVDLAAGKLPVSGEMRAVGPERDQKAAIALDDGGDDDDGRHFGGEAPAATGWTHASLPFDSITFART